MGTQTVRFRTRNSPHTGQQSNWLIHQGPNEAAAATTLNSANPTAADWLAAATGGTTANDRIEKNVDNNGGLQPGSWIWMSGDGHRRQHRRELLERRR
jgi:hypothetical protein